jgi:multiple sugar transport system substrate-binding protein
MSAASWLEPIAARYNEQSEGRVKVQFHAMSFPDLFKNIIDQAATGSNLYDGFVTPPSIAGSIVEYSGWQDLAPYIQADGDRASDWADILLGYRQTIATYQGQTIMYPLDGDILSLYYRDDILKYFNLQVPRTWDEYNEVARAVHGKVYQNATLVGSCVGRVKDFAGPYWANLVISSLTQTQGQFEGHLFSTADLQPLTGPAIEKALEWMEGQVRYGVVDGTFLPGLMAMGEFYSRLVVSYLGSRSRKLTRVVVLVLCGPFC